MINNTKFTYACGENEATIILIYHDQVVLSVATVKQE